jgi:hypothetical protein
MVGIGDITEVIEPETKHGQIEVLYWQRNDADAIDREFLSVNFIHC